jgi:hypothetical protein
MKKPNTKRKEQERVNDLSDPARSNTASSQSELPKPKTRREDMPEADRDRFHDGVYSGTGTGAGPGGSTATGGADASSMNDRSRPGSTEDRSGG